jgi:phosphatidylserine/phosphatidylglycerophosphate/cardiolipin synthase-like enzyme
MTWSAWRALSSRRVRPGDGALILRSVSLPVAWAEGLAALKEWPLPHLLEVIRARRAEAARLRPPPIEVVRTQPVQPGLEGLDTATVLRRLFSQAREEVWIAGFRLTEPELFRPLVRAGKPLRVRLLVEIDLEVDVFGRSQPRQSAQTWPARWHRLFLEQIWLEELPPPEILYAPSTLYVPGAVPRSMHAKTVLVDRRRWLVTSANFTDRGQSRNFELGALMEDSSAAAEVVRWVEEGIGAGFFIVL